MQRGGLRPRQLVDRGQVLPQAVEKFPLGIAGAADGDHRQAALNEATRQCAPAAFRPLLVLEHWRCMNHGVVAGGRGRRGAGQCRRDGFRHARNADRIRQPQHQLDAMHIAERWHAALKYEPFERRAGAAFRRYQADAPPSRHEGEERGPVAALSRNAQVVAPPQLRDQLEDFGRRRSRRHDDHPIDVRIAFDDVGRAFKDQHVDFRLWPGAFHAADQRCRQQQVADSAQTHHQDAWALGKRDGGGHCHRNPNSPAPALWRGAGAVPRAVRATPSRYTSRVQPRPTPASARRHRCAGVQSHARAIAPPDCRARRY